MFDFYSRTGLKVVGFNLYDYIISRMLEEYLKAASTLFQA
jgi:hypothetical protein